MASYFVSYTEEVVQTSNYNYHNQDCSLSKWTTNTTINSTEEYLVPNNQGATRIEQDQLFSTSCLYTTDVQVCAAVINLPGNVHKPKWGKATQP